MPIVIVTALTPCYGLLQRYCPTNPLKRKTSPVNGNSNEPRKAVERFIPRSGIPQLRKIMLKANFVKRGNL